MTSTARSLQQGSTKHQQIQQLKGERQQHKQACLGSRAASLHVAGAINALAKGMTHDYVYDDLSAFPMFSALVL
jgi:hypothetical protein